MSDVKTFNLTPHPRILPMLGEIVLPQWKCLAELLDNSIDGFLEAERLGEPISSPQVHITIPTDSRVQGQISVKDNGPGMDFATLERAARAGWTSHDPINNLGLFGMGFNIATARLGAKTTIWTTRGGALEWVGMSIDFDELGKDQAFLTPVLTRPKQNSDTSGTEIIIERLKPEQREWFAKASNRSNVSRLLGRTYSAMLGVGQPIHFRLEVNGPQVRPRQHCIWGGPDSPEPRTAEHPSLGTIDAYQDFDFGLAARDFCVQCWNWLGVGQATCPQCQTDGKIVNRPRRVHGWIGLQRYLDNSDYGFDLLRNGRKIELGNKDLFGWYDEGTDTQILEYPIDDPRNRGRFVGEIHIDHCRVPYTKDRFVREDTAWSEMVELIRGSGPLQPEKAKERGFSGNTSPLYKLFQVYRRSSPHNKRVGGWRKLLVVEDNSIAVNLAKRFEAGESEYQSDAKWWELAKQADEDVLTGGNPAGGGNPAPGGSGDIGGPAPLGGGGPLGGAPSGGGLTGAADTPDAPPGITAHARAPIADLSQLYTEDSTMQRFDVKAFAIDSKDLGIPTTVPWGIWKTTAGPWEFLVRIDHPIFSSVTMTPLDALLTQLAWQATDFAREQGSAHNFAKVLAGLRSRYAKRHEIDVSTLSREAERQLQEAAKSIVERVKPEQARAFFEGLGASKDQILITMAKRGVATPQDAVESGRFLQYSPASIIKDFVSLHLDLFLDGAYWEDSFKSLDFGSPVATNAVRDSIKSHFSSLLADAVWLAEQSENELGDASRERLLRASASIQILSMGSAKSQGIE